MRRCGAPEGFIERGRLLHEAGHAFVGAACGLRISSVDLRAGTDGVVEFETIPDKTEGDFEIAIAVAVAGSLSVALSENQASSGIPAHNAADRTLVKQARSASNNPKRAYGPGVDLARRLLTEHADTHLELAEYLFKLIDDRWDDAECAPRSQIIAGADVHFFLRKRGIGTRRRGRE
jgi:hypothetical protein